MISSSKTFPGVYAQVTPSAPGALITAADLSLVAPVSIVVPAGEQPDTSEPDPTAVDLLGYEAFGPMGISAVTIKVAHSTAGFDFESIPDLVSIAFPNLINIDPGNSQGGYFTITFCPLLTTISLPVFIPNTGGSGNASYGFFGNALSVATVNALLHQFAATPGFNTGGALNLSGGTSAAPTGQGITDKATLIGRGVSVTTN